MDYKNDVIKSQAEIIMERIKRGLLFGEPIDADNIDALVLSAYLMGEQDERERGYKNFQILSSLQKAQTLFDVK